MLSRQSALIVLGCCAIKKKKQTGRQKERKKKKTKTVSILFCGFTCCHHQFDLQHTSARRSGLHSPAANDLRFQWYCCYCCQLYLLEPPPIRDHFCQRLFHQPANDTRIESEGDEEEEEEGGQKQADAKRDSTEAEI